MGDEMKTHEVLRVLEEAARFMANTADKQRTYAAARTIASNLIKDCLWTLRQRLRFAGTRDDGGVE